MTTPELGRVTIADLAPGDGIVLAGTRDDRGNYTLTRGTVYLVIPEDGTILLTDASATGHQLDGKETVGFSYGRLTIRQNVMEIYRVRKVR